MCFLKILWSQNVNKCVPMTISLVTRHTIAVYINNIPQYWSWKFVANKIQSTEHCLGECLLTFTHPHWQVLGILSIHWLKSVCRDLFSIYQLIYSTSNCIYRTLQINSPMSQSTWNFEEYLSLTLAFDLQTLRF